MQGPTHPKAWARWGLQARAGATISRVVDHAVNDPRVLPHTGDRHLVRVAEESSVHPVAEIEVGVPVQGEDEPPRAIYYVQHHDAGAFPQSGAR